MTVVLFICGILIVVVGLAVSIALHELGHLSFAKLFKVRVPQYMIGFGPTLFSFRRGETEYGVKAIPLGGYISMIGMYPPAKDGSGSTRRSSTGIFQELAGQARRAEAERLQPGDENRTFYNLAIHKRMLIMLAGPFMNLILGAIILGAVLMTFGVATPTTTVQSVSKCVVSAQVAQERAQEEKAHGKQGAPDGADDGCRAGDPQSPASLAGLKPGDKITSFDSRPAKDWGNLSNAIRDAAGRTVPITYVRDGQEHTSSITPMLTSRPETDASGMPVREHGQMAYSKVGFIGVGPTTENVPQPVGAVPGLIWDQMSRMGGVLVNLPERVYQVGVAAFTDKPRDPDSVMSVVGVGRVAGEITSMQSIPLGARVASVILLVGSLNLVLFMFNLIPLPPLDGGHVAGALYEGGRRGFAKLFRRKDPGHFDLAKLIPLTYAVAGVFILMSLLLVYADIVKPVSLT